MTQSPTDTCPFCGFSTRGQISGHLQLECIRALASELRAVRDAACQTARELCVLKTRLQAPDEPPAIHALQSVENPM